MILFKFIWRTLYELMYNTAHLLHRTKSWVFEESLRLDCGLFGKCVAITGEVLQIQPISGIFWIWFDSPGFIRNKRVRWDYGMKIIYVSLYKISTHSLYWLHSMYSYLHTKVHTKYSRVTWMECLILPGGLKYGNISN